MMRVDFSRTIVSDPTILQTCLDSICAIENSTFNRPWSRADFFQEINDVNSRILVLLNENQLRGYLFSRLAVDEISINKLCVHPDFRGRGFGKALLCELFDRNCKRCRSVFLEVDSQNIPAVSLYTGAGFSVIRVRKKIYANGADALEMVYKFPRRS